MSGEKVKQKKSLRRNFLIALAVIVVGGAAVAGLAWYSIFGPNTKTPKDGIFLYIPTAASFSTVMDSLDKHNVLTNRSSFTRLARKKAYIDKVKAGRYLITNGMSNNKLINMLRAGHQSPVMVTFNSIRTLKQLAGRLSQQLEPDSLVLYKYLSDETNAKKYGFTADNVMLMFIPNTYEFFWNTSPEKLLERMNQEYLRFWNNTRKESASDIGLSKLEVGVLASIVEMETVKADERPVVAGVYINRLRRGIPLEADPTVIFAIGDFSIRRVLNKHLAHPSPYNTYLNKGLPPGPIAMPSVSSLDAVLKYKKHNYIFFCARPDLSGYHSFATNLSDHMNNARAYQRALDKMNIK